MVVTAEEFVEEIDQLEVEHRDLAVAIDGLDVTSADFDTRVTEMLDDLAVHVEREDLGDLPGLRGHPGCHRVGDGRPGTRRLPRFLPHEPENIPPPDDLE